jgi:curved DNA-binding protein CbpA
MTRNYYQILQVPVNATPKDIKIAFRNLAKKFHPDKNPGNKQYEEEFKLINEAYHTLSDQNKKWAYDMSLFLKQNPSVSSSQSYSDNTFYKRRRYRPRAPYAYSKAPPQQFTFKIYVQAAFFIAIMVVAVIVCISLLNSYSSHYYYQEAVKDYQRGHFRSALSNLDFSILDFGNKNAQASLLAAKILIYEFDNFNNALDYLEKGLKNAKISDNIAEIHYLKGLCLKNKGMFGEAYEQYLKSIAHNTRYDSSYYELGEINTFIFNDYHAAIENFNDLLNVNSLFSDAYLGKGICYQKLDEHSLAVMNFEKFISLNSSEGTAYYLKSLSEIELDNMNSACKDLNVAYNLGIHEATELLQDYCR